MCVSQGPAATGLGQFAKSPLTLQAAVKDMERRKQEEVEKVRGSEAPPSLYTGCGGMRFAGMTVGVCDLGSMVKVIENKGLTVAEGVRYLERVLQDKGGLQEKGELKWVLEKRNELCVGAGIPEDSVDAELF